jgi:hypothetical protein
MSGLLILAVTSWVHIAAYTFNDTLRDIVPGGQGKDAVKEIVRLLERTDLQYRSDPETDAFRKFMRATLENFDFMKLYESPYLKDLGNGFRGLGYQGCSIDNHYLVNIVTEKNDRCEVSHIWDFSTRYALKKNDACIAGGRSFIATIDSTTATGRYSNRNALLFFDGLLKVIDPVNIRSLNAPVCELYGDIKGDSRKVIDEFYRQFPKVSELFNRYSTIRSFLEIKSHNNIQYTALSFRYGYRLKNLKADFPELAKSISNINGLYLINMKVKNAANHTAMSIVFDSRDDVLSVSLYTRRGRLIPFDDAGNPVFSEELSLSNARDMPYYAVFDMVHDVHGLKFITDNMVVRFRYRDTPGRGLWTMKLEEVSKTRITGSYYHIIPRWLIDMFVPSNMEQMVYDVSRVMLNANGGAGSSITFEWDTRNPAHVMLRFSAISEFMDNYFLKYGLRVWAKSTINNKRLFSEAKALTARFMEAFSSDYRI